MKEDTICCYYISKRMTKEALKNHLASFPGSPLAPTKNKKGGGEPGTDSHVTSRHNDVAAIITKVVAQLCSHVIA